MKYGNWCSVCESAPLFWNHESINTNGFGYRLNLCINPHDKTNDHRNLHSRKKNHKRCHSPLSPVFDRRAVLPHCCPETSLMPLAKRRAGRWTRTTTGACLWPGSSPAPLPAAQRQIGEQTSGGLSPRRTSRHTAAVVIEATLSQNASIPLKPLLLAKAAPAVRDILMVSQKASASRRVLKVDPARGSRPAGLGCSTYPRKCLWTAGASRPGGASSSASFSLKGSPGPVFPQRHWPPSSAGRRQQLERWALQSPWWLSSQREAVGWGSFTSGSQTFTKTPGATCCGQAQRLSAKPSSWAACATPAGSLRRQRPSSRGCRFWSCHPCTGC